MKNEKIFILGAGGMGREVFTYYQDLNRLKDVKGFVEQNSTRSGQTIRNIPILDEKELVNEEELRLIAGIGNPLRKGWIEMLTEQGYRFDVLIHQHAYVGENVHIGEGAIICPGSVLTCDITLGKHVIVNINAGISHDCQIGDYVTVAPGANIGGRVEIGAGTWVGIGSTIIQDIKIGNGAFIAAGSVVVEDVPDNTLVMGVPARVSRLLEPSDWKELI